MQEPVINQCGLSALQLQAAQRDKQTIKHPSRPEGTYVILGFGKMKCDGEWFDSCTYMNVKTRESYTRKVDDFKKFYLKNK